MGKGNLIKCGACARVCSRRHRHGVGGRGTFAITPRVSDAALFCKKSMRVARRGTAYGDEHERIATRVGHTYDEKLDGVFLSTMNIEIAQKNAAFAVFVRVRCRGDSRRRHCRVL